MPSEPSTATVRATLPAVGTVIGDSEPGDGTGRIDLAAVPVAPASA